MTIKSVTQKVMSNKVGNACLSFSFGAILVSAGYAVRALGVVREIKNAGETALVEYSTSHAIVDAHDDCR